MIPTRRSLVFALVQSALLLFGVVFTSLALARTSHWAEYTSKNFVVYSDRKSAEAKAVVTEFERFREAALALTGLPSTEETIPVQIFLFGRQRDYLEFQPDKSIAGYFRDTWQGPRMVVGAEAKLTDASLVLFHEYVHYLMRSRSQRRYPLWYEEGFADLLAASSIEERHMVVGLVHPWRTRDLGKGNLMPVAELLVPADTEDPKYWARYYASSWIFMHFLQLGHLSGEIDQRAGITSFLLAGSYDNSIGESFRKHFGITAEQMDARLKAYAEKRVWAGYKMEVKGYLGPLTERRLGANETAHLLGDLAYRSGQQQTALEWLKKIDGKQTSVARPFALRAVIEQHMERGDLATHILGFALQQGEHDPYVLTNAAHVYWDKARQSGTESEQVNYLRRGAGFAERAVQSDVSSLEAGYFLSQIYRRQAKHEDAVVILKTLYRRFPFDVRLNLELGSLLASSKDPGAAVPFLERVIAWDHASTRRRQARQLLQSLGRTLIQAPIEVDEDHPAPILIHSR